MPHLRPRTKASKKRRARLREKIKTGGRTGLGIPPGMATVPSSKVRHAAKAAAKKAAATAAPKP